MRTLKDRADTMRAALVQTAPDGQLAAAGTLRRGRVLPWRALLAAALLSLTLGAALYEALPAGRTSAPTAARSHGLAQQALLSLPLAAQSPASAALGSDSPAYAIRPSAGALSAASPAQHLSASFSASGVSVRSGAAHFRLRLLGVGYGSALQTIGAVTPTGHANRVLYAHPGVEEWYANGPLGLEQGFQIAKAPAGQPTAPLTLQLALSGNAHATLDRGGQSLTLNHPGSSPLRYTGLTASDARGHALRSWLSLEHGGLLLRVDARGARYPLHIDPFVQQGEKLTGSGESGKAQLGYGVAVSEHGDTLLVGGPADNGATGAAWVFIRSGGKWTQQGEKLTGGEEAGAGEFGRSVAVSADGNTALIGGMGDSAGAGAAWVFTRSGGVWTQQGAKLRGSSEVGPAIFGSNVSLSADGNTALIGAVEDTEGTGAAWVFTRAGGKWAQLGAKLTGGGATGPAHFGSVALSGDGNTALIGGPFDGGVGAAWVFTRSGSSFTQQGSKLTGSGETGAGEFGFSTSLSRDGNTALIGGLRDNKKGAAWVFTRSGSTWSQQGEKLTGTGESGEGTFGGALALSSDGNTALVGAGVDNGGKGAAWAFNRSGETWTQQPTKLTGQGETGGGNFGWSIALSADGTTGVMGGVGDNTLLGAAWVFVDIPTVQTQPATEVKDTTATLNGTVNPRGEEVTSCSFEYGTTTAYGSSAPCSPAPGKGESPVAVSAAIGSLSPNTVYHFQISGNWAKGTNLGADQSFTTLATSATGETKEASKPAKATDGELSAEASGGTGKVTIGPYGSNIGGTPLIKGAGKYVQAYHSTGASFTKIEIKDCELGGAKSLWWNNPATGWEAISAPTAVYTETPSPCITVTATESTKPSVAQLSDPRFRGGPPGAEEYGKCEAAKRALYTEGACLTIAEKKGKPSFKGKFEWYPAPVECFPMKNGRYGDSKCTTVVEKKGKPKGKFEKGSSSFTGTSGPAKFEVHSQAPIECEASSSEGQLRAPKFATQVITYSGCKRESIKCQGAGEPPGAIRTSPLESYTYEEAQKFFVVLSGAPIMRFSCAATQFTLSGALSGETTGDLNVMSAKSESAFSKSLGEQKLLMTEGSGVSFEATLTASAVTIAAQPTELKTRP